MDIIIGSEIRQTMAKKNWLAGGLAHSLGVNPGSVSRLFKQKSIQTSQLLQISRILNFDFFAIYSAELKNPNTETKAIDTPNRNCETLLAEKIIEIEALKKEIETLKIDEIKKENSFLKQINELLKKK